MIIFYGNKPVDEIGKNCFSQWFPSVFFESGMRFVTSEQYMMYRKAFLFEDFVIANKILKESDPFQCKKHGRAVRNFDEFIWKKAARGIVFEGNLLKFSQNSEMKDYLLSTGEEYIVEASYKDSLWGNGLDEATTLNTPPDKWPGTNWLGQVLMEVRKSLKPKFTGNIL